jgi:hypothetical protein
MNYPTWLLDRIGQMRLARRRASWRKYKSTPKGHASRARYEATDRAADRKWRYDVSVNGMLRSIRANAKRRGMRA